MNPFISAQGISQTSAEQPAPAAAPRAARRAWPPGGAAPFPSGQQRSRPGCIAMRGCPYSHFSGLFAGPVRDLLVITHGPIGCAFYSWLARDSQAGPLAEGEVNYMPYCLSSDLAEDSVVFGGVEKLMRAVEEAHALFKPGAIAILSTCPTGLIGDDIHKAARELTARLGIEVIAFSCEGFSHALHDDLMENRPLDRLLGTAGAGVTAQGEFRVNVLGEFNRRGDGCEIERLLRRAGLTQVSVFSGNGRLAELARAGEAGLSLLLPHPVARLAAEGLTARFGIPWMPVSFDGAAATADSLRRIGTHFGDEGLRRQIEAVIETEMARVERVRAAGLPVCAGKRALLFAGGPAAMRWQGMLEAAGMLVFTVSPEPPPGARPMGQGAEGAGRPPQPMLSPGDMALGMPLFDCLRRRTLASLAGGAAPDLVCLRAEERPLIEKHGLPCLTLPDSGGFQGFEGAIRLWREAARALSTPAWRLIRPPWIEAEKA